MHTQASSQSRIIAYGQDVGSPFLALKPLQINNGALNVNTYSSTPWSYTSPAGGLVNYGGLIILKNVAATGIKNYVTSLQLSSTALLVATEFVIQDITGAVLFRQWMPLTGYPTAVNITFNNPLVSTGSGANSRLLAGSTVAAGAATAIYISAQGFEGA